jgi:hypothetical protein
VPDDARPIDAEGVEELDRAVGVRVHADSTGPGSIAAAVAEQIDNDDPVPRGDERDDLAPEMARGRETVNQNDGLAGAACPCGVVVQARPVEVDKLAPHGERTMAGPTAPHKERPPPGGAGALRERIDRGRRMWQ